MAGLGDPVTFKVFAPAGIRAISEAPELEGIALVMMTTSQAMFLCIFHESPRHPWWRSRPAKLVRHGLALVLLPSMLAASKVALIREDLVTVRERREV